MTHTYQIAGMTCGSCVARVKSELLKLGDITAADIQLAYPQATLSMNRHIPLQQLQDAVAKAGPYTITAAGNEKGAVSSPATMEERDRPSYLPLYLLFGYITLGTLIVQWNGGAFDWMEWMRHFMAAFFLVFSFFKLMNLRGFAEGYRMYDVVARRFPAWGYVYPFTELLLGLAYLTGIAPLATGAATLLIMGVSTIGVVQSLLRRSKITCACLGTVIRLPLSSVTLVEDGLMVAMSAFMLFYLIA